LTSVRNFLSSMTTDSYGEIEIMDIKRVTDNLIEGADLDTIFEGEYFNTSSTHFYDVNRVKKDAEQHFPASHIPIKHVLHSVSQGASTEPDSSPEFKARAQRIPKNTPPITVIKTPDGTHHVVDGRHRVLRAHASGETHISAHVIPSDFLSPKHMLSGKALQRVRRGEQ